MTRSVIHFWDVVNLFAVCLGEAETNKFIRINVVLKIFVFVFPKFYVTLKLKKCET